MTSSPNGSSPLARGLPYGRPVHHLLDGIIPARAGFTPISSRKPIFLPGSSPLARGLPGRVKESTLERGIIPARAGFTRHYRSEYPCPWDHPRSRGVYSSRTGQPAANKGSSPLARGLPADGLNSGPVSRIIPARAGFTPRLLGPARPVGDHPRSRGVYFLRSTSMAAVPGSSPLARGLPGQRRHPSGAPGIIPARAGFTSAYDSSVLMTNGSSPLARGLPSTIYRAYMDTGIIPARAGFTGLFCLCSASHGDHPRSRGVYCELYGCRGCVRGSSPLARGLPHQRINESVLVGSSPLARGLHNDIKGKNLKRRIIPARAGFTSPVSAERLAQRDHPRSRGVYGLMPSTG